MPYWLKPRHIWWSQGSLAARWKQQYTTSELFNAANKHALVCVQHSMRVYRTVAFRGHLGPFETKLLTCTGLERRTAVLSSAELFRESRQRC
jgi:hypothetical protein